MKMLARLFPLKPALAPAVARQVAAWQRLAPEDDARALAEARFVIVDTETSGLDVRRDRLLSIGAVAVEAMRLAPQRTFSAVLRNDMASSRENILLHGLTPTAQAAGEPPDQALVEFLTFVGKSPCVAFHARFDQAVLQRALRATLGVRLPNPWIDLALLAPALVPQARRPQALLDEWLSYFRLQAHVRHNAVHDAQVTAELFLILLARAAAHGIATVAALRAAVAEYARRVPGASE